MAETLVQQPTAKPTRKVAFAALASAAVTLLIALAPTVGLNLPGVEFAPTDSWVAVVNKLIGAWAPTILAYAFKERARTVVP